jgi:hypothetical protein
MRVEFTFPSLDLGSGSYSLTAALHRDAAHIAASYDWWDRAIVFQVVRRNGPMTIGVCAMQIEARWYSAEVAEPSAEPNEGGGRHETQRGDRN